MREHKRNPDFFSVGGYDGMHLIYETLKKTGGKTDGDALIAAAKGMAWTARAARCRSIRKPATSCRRSTCGGSRRSATELVNVEFDKLENVKDPVKARAKN